MRLTSPTEVRALLEEMDFKPSRILGQNFLIDGNILRILVDLADLQPSDGVLEIGPGLGVLTAPLIERAARVVAIEKDDVLYEKLAERLAEAANLELIHADALAVDLPGLLAGGSFDGRDGIGAVAGPCRPVASVFADRTAADPVPPFGVNKPVDVPRLVCPLNKVVANLPYSVGSRLLVELARAPHRPERMVVTVQREVADRMVAGPGSRDFGVLSVFLQLDYEPFLRKRVSRTCFFPAPQVESALVELRRRPQRVEPLENESGFHELVRTCFAHRRKQLGAILRKPEAIAAAGLNAQQRPETLSIGDWIRLANRV